MKASLTGRQREGFARSSGLGRPLALKSFLYTGLKANVTSAAARAQAVSERRCPSRPVLQTAEQPRPLIPQPGL